MKPGFYGKGGFAYQLLNPGFYGKGGFAYQLLKLGFPSRDVEGLVLYMIITFRCICLVSECGVRTVSEAPETEKESSGRADGRSWKQRS